MERKILGMIENMIQKHTSHSRFIREIPRCKLEEPVKALAMLLSKYQYLDILAVFYELGCEHLEIFTFDEITQAVDIAAQKQGRPTLREEWNFLKKLITEHNQKDSSVIRNDKNSRFDSNKDLLFL